MTFEKGKYRPKNPCQRCGTSLRYKGGNDCVKCQIERSARNEADKKLRIRMDNWKTKMEGIDYASN